MTWLGVLEFLLSTNTNWNVGHILVKQLLFMYKRKKLPFTIKTDFIEKFMSGTMANNNTLKEDIYYLKVSSLHH